MRNDRAIGRRKRLVARNTFIGKSKRPKRNLNIFTVHTASFSATLADVTRASPTGSRGKRTTGRGRVNRKNAWRVRYDAKSYIASFIEAADGFRRRTVASRETSDENNENRFVRCRKFEKRSTATFARSAVSSGKWGGGRGAWKNSLSESRRPPTKRLPRSTASVPRTTGTSQVNLPGKKM